jgi:methylmalonyl-CoA/ethylmalonyl-CoA epimerase
MSLANRPTRIAHLGIAVQSFHEALPFYRDQLGLEVQAILELPERGLRVAMLACGESLIELLEPMGEGSQVSAFLAKRGPGVHHVCLAVPELQAKLDALHAEGVALVSRTPEIGAEGCPVAFIHPKATRGVLLELLEDPGSPG